MELPSGAYSAATDWMMETPTKKAMRMPKFLHWFAR
jgi:hypothetical protein